MPSVALILIFSIALLFVTGKLYIANLDMNFEIDNEATFNEVYNKEIFGSNTVAN